MSSSYLYSSLESQQPQIMVIQESGARRDKMGLECLQNIILRELSTFNLIVLWKTPPAKLLLFDLTLNSSSEKRPFLKGTCQQYLEVMVSLSNFLR